MAYGQSPQWRDPMLLALEGTWKGTVESAGTSRPCEITYAFALQGAFLEGTQTVFKDASKRVVVAEERIYLKSGTEESISVNTFSSSGVSRWGSWTGSAKSWTGEMQGSDGSRVALTIEFTDATHLVRTATVINEAGEVAEAVTVRIGKTMKVEGGRGKVAGER